MVVVLIRFGAVAASGSSSSIGIGGSSSSTGALRRGLEPDDDDDVAAAVAPAAAVGGAETAVLAAEWDCENERCCWAAAPRITDGAAAASDKSDDANADADDEADELDVEAVLDAKTRHAVERGNTWRSAECIVLRLCEKKNKKQKRMNKW